MIDRDKILKAAVAAYGQEAQERMMMEEMAELTKAICKTYRSDDIAATSAAVLEEMADVQIMLDQMRIFYGDTLEIENVKLRRLADMLNLTVSDEDSDYEEQT